MKTKIYYDGVNIKEFIDQVDGVTTNTSYIASAGITDYNKFIDESIEAAKGKPISFQVTETDMDSIINQAKYIAEKGENVYVKIPIVLPNGESTKEIIRDLHISGVKVNITCIHTVQQTIDACSAVIYNETPSIISLFAGGVFDSGSDPKKMFDVANELIGNNKNIEILYAGCQRVYSVPEADNWKSDIITVPDAVMKKLNRMEYNQLETSIKKSKLFFEDGSKLNFNL